MDNVEMAIAKVPPLSGQPFVHDHINPLDFILWLRFKDDFMIMIIDIDDDDDDDDDDDVDDDNDDDNAKEIHHLVKDRWNCHLWNLINFKKESFEVDLQRECQWLRGLWAKRH